MAYYTTAKKVVQKLVDHGYIAYLAGGFVRDLLMKVPSDDIDIVTNAPVAVTQSLFPKTIPVGINFGILIVVEDDFQYELATFRKESEHLDGRRPEKVENASPEEDAKRRDFTINGMFYDPLKEVLYDFVEGQKDLQNRLIRAIGNPHDRFLEDRLRMVRAVRYAARFQFDIEHETMKAILFHAKELFPAVAIERVWQELKKMDQFDHFEEALYMLHKYTLLGVIFPPLKDLSLEELKPRLKTIASISPTAPLIAKIFELFPDSRFSDRLSLCEYLKLSNKEKEFTQELELWRSTETFDLYDWAKLYAKPNSLICEQITSLHQKDPSFIKTHTKRREELQGAIERIHNKTTLVSSKHLIQRGIQPGPQMGELLEKGERIAINEGLTSPEAVLKHLL